MLCSPVDSNMEAAVFSETPKHFCQTARRCVSEDRIFTLAVVRTSNLTTSTTELLNQFY